MCHAITRLLYPAFQRRLVVFKLLFFRTFMQVLEGRNEQTHIPYQHFGLHRACTHCFFVLFFKRRRCVREQLVYAGFLDSALQRKIKLPDIPRVLHLFTSRHIQTASPSARKQAAPLDNDTHTTHSKGSRGENNTVTSLGSSFGETLRFGLVFNSDHILQRPNRVVRQT